MQEEDIKMTEPDIQVKLKYRKVIKLLNLQGKTAPQFNDET